MAHPTKFTLDALFIIDPFITIPLLVGCIIAKRTKKPQPAYWGDDYNPIYELQ